MLKKLFYSFITLISIQTTAQVGINTNTPQGVLHVNSSDNRSTTDDVVISTAGNIAVGHIAPDVKLDIRTSGTTTTPVSGFKLVDGRQANGRVLHSNKEGVATWKDIVLFNNTPVVGTFSWAANTNIGNTNWNSISSISVPPGTHMVYIKIHVLNTPASSANNFFRTYVGTKNLGTNNANANDTPILGGTNFQPYIGRDFEMTQSFVYTNTSTTNVTLYFNIQSDVSTIRRSQYTFDNRVGFLGVNLIENYFLSIPAS